MPDLASNLGADLTNDDRNMRGNHEPHSALTAEEAATRIITRTGGPRT